MLPEILSYEPTRPARFPDNGRTLTDDAVDVFLTILTNGKVTGDKVGLHRDLLAEFPYLGHPTNEIERLLDTHRHSLLLRSRCRRGCGCRLAGCGSAGLGPGLQLLRELIPNLACVAVLASTPATDPFSGPFVDDLRSAATSAGLRLQAPP